MSASKGARIQGSNYNPSCEQTTEYRLMKVRSNPETQKSQWMKVSYQARTSPPINSHSEKNTGWLRFPQKQERKETKALNNSETKTPQCGTREIPIRISPSKEKRIQRNIDCPAAKSKKGWKWRKGMNSLEMKILQYARP
jgi:hypothetical protein